MYKKRDLKWNLELHGLAQVRVRNNATWDERIEIDIEYINNISFKLDVKIILKTIMKVIKREDIYKK